MNFFVVSDIHGMDDPFEVLLKYWNPEDKLVILGDLIDRGPKSLQVIRRLMKLKHEHGEQVVLIKGNHDQMIFDFFNAPEEKASYYYMNGGLATVLSFLQDVSSDLKEANPKVQAEYIQAHFQDELDFLRSGKLYAVLGDVLFTHAGFDSTQKDFTKTEDRDFFWIRNHYLQPNLTPYVNVFGHTPTFHIHDSNDIWVSEDRKYIGVDGGFAYDGQLNGVLLSNRGEIVETFAIKASEYYNY